MFKIFKNIFPIITFIFFMILIVFFYISEENIIAINKSRSSYALKFDLKDLPLIKNDTNNVIEYSEDIEIFKKDKKRYIFWDLIEK